MPNLAEVWIGLRYNLIHFSSHFNWNIFLFAGISRDDFLELITATPDTLIHPYVIEFEISLRNMWHHLLSRTHFWARVESDPATFTSWRLSVLNEIKHHHHSEGILKILSHSWRNAAYIFNFVFYPSEHSYLFFIRNLILYHNIVQLHTFEILLDLRAMLKLSLQLSLFFFRLLKLHVTRSPNNTARYLWLVWAQSCVLWRALFSDILHVYISAGAESSIQ